MDRIDGPGNFLFRPDLENQDKKAKKKSKTPASGFKNVLGTLISGPATNISLAGSEGIQNDEELEEIVDSIHRYGDELIKFPGVDNLARYKQAVGNFIRHVVRNAYTVEEQLSRKNILNQKKYTIVKVVDEKLENLSRAVLGAQNKQMDLLGSIEEIQGLLVDILHVQ